MKLLRMTATFGCLENAVLELTEGLNLLELPNESGKSTWCAFLRAMFYGLESRKGAALSERNRALPWSGAAMSGTVDLLWQGREITLRRFPKGSDPFGGFQAVYTGTEEPVPGLTAANAGETILGVTKDVFQRTCFIPQGGLSIDASGDLERRIAALASAGEEDVSFSDAEGRLRDWRNARQANRAVGSLPRLRDQLAQVQSQRQRLLDARARGEEAQAELARLETQRKALEADLDRHQAAAQEERLAAHRARCDAAGKRLADAEDALIRTRQAAEDARAAVPPPPAAPLLCWLPFLLGLALSAGALFARLPLWLVPVFALAGLAAALWLLRRRREAVSARAAALDALRQADAALSDAQAGHIAAQAAWEAIAAQDGPGVSDAPASPPQNDLADDRARLDRVRSAMTLCADRRARAQGEEAALGGLAPMDEQLAALTAAIAREEAELAALNLALEALTAANARLLTRFSPALNAKAGDILARLTGGRYTALTFTREFQALAHSPAGARSAQLLSQGTADQVYLALRLAICLLALPGEDPAPLVLDDALVSFDDARLKLALELLRELARDRQVLVFTCQSRERAALG